MNKLKRPRDPNQRAKLIVDIATGEVDDMTTGDLTRLSGVTTKPDTSNEKNDTQNEKGNK